MLGGYWVVLVLTTEEVCVFSTRPAGCDAQYRVLDTGDARPWGGPPLGGVWSQLHGRTMDDNTSGARLVEPARGRIALFRGSRDEEVSRRSNAPTPPSPAEAVARAEFYADRALALKAVGLEQ